MNSETNYEEYMLQLRLAHGDYRVNKALDYFTKHVGRVTRREQARFLAHVFEYLPEDNRDHLIYGVSVFTVRRYLSLPLRYEDI